MKLKRIKLSTINLYKFIILFCCVQKPWTTAKIPDLNSQQNNLWYQRYGKSNPPTTTTTTTVSYYKGQGVHEAIHAFNPSLHLRHTQYTKYYHSHPTTTTTIRPTISAKLLQNSYRHAYSADDQKHLHAHYNQVNQFRLGNGQVGNGIVRHHFNNHHNITQSNGIIATTQTTATPNHSSSLQPTSSSTPQPKRISLLSRDEHFRKITRAENVFPFDKIRTQTPSSTIELNRIRSTYNSRNTNDGGGTEVDDDGGSISSSSSKRNIRNNSNRRNEENNGMERVRKTGWQNYLNGFNERNEQDDILTNVQPYFKRPLTTDKDEDTLIDDGKNTGGGGGGKRIESKNSRKQIYTTNNHKNDNIMDEDENADDDDDDDDEDYDDLYLDDESVLEDGTTSSLTEEKWRNFGTADAVEKSRKKTFRSMHQMAAHNATAHISRIYSEALCKIPRPKIIPIVAEPSKTYVPHCTVLHRCGDDTGCCRTGALTCVPKRTTTVDLYFYVSTLGKREPSVESLSFINHTECHCVNRHERQDYHRNSQSKFRTSNQNGADSAASAMPFGSSTNQTEPHCGCVKYFMEFIERIVDTDDGDADEGSDSGETHRRCRCDCQAGNATCQSYKKGIEGFSIEDRRCILDKRCAIPTCEYGQYIKRTGRCPKFEDKLASARNLFFD